MERKEIQEQRIRGYFIDATREMLKGEGLKSINVRAVAERAGYSYATLYNYFKDIKELIFICVNDFQTEAEAFIGERTREASPGKERIRETVIAYANYFVQYPGIFELFYLEKINDLSPRQPTAERIVSFPSRLMHSDWQVCIQAKTISTEQAMLKEKALNSMLTGMLLLFLNRHNPASYEEFMKDLGEQASLILA